MAAIGSLVVGDIGTIIELDLTEPDSNNVQQPTTFVPSTDTVNFVFTFSDGTKKTGTGLFATASKAKYTTVSGDVVDSPGRCELQLQITSSAWTGSTEILILNVIKKL